MLSDAHAHPQDLLERFPGAEEERRRLGVACAASAWNVREFERHEEIARQARLDGAPPLILCFAVHPQLPAARFKAGEGGALIRESLASLESLAAEGRLEAVGETGFDLYNQAFRETEALQEELFLAHLEIAGRCGLPLVLHVRRAMHKVFAHDKALKALPAVVFHSYSGTFAEGEALLRRGINAYFSFGAAIVLNHKTAMDACARLPLDRLLLETDAPYQPLRGAPFSRWADLPVIARGAAALRAAAGKAGGTAEELEAAAEAGWRKVFA
jgi:TatD DNase family protein